MSQEFKKCLERNKIKSFAPGVKLDISLVESLLEAKNLREAADYYGDFSKINCQKLVKNAERFMKTAKNILN